MESPSTNHASPAEAIVYLGSALILAFGSLGVALTWDAMTAGTQVLVLVAAATVVAAAALVTPTTTAVQRRIGDASGSTSAILAGWASGLLAASLGASDDRALGVGAAVGGAVGIGWYLRSRGVLPQLIMGSGLVGAVAFLASDGGAGPEVVVASTMITGLAWWAVGTFGLLRPAWGPAALGGLVVLGSAMAALAVDAPWMIGLTALAAATFGFVDGGLTPGWLNRGLAVATGLVAIAHLGTLIEDPVLRVVVGGIGVGVGAVVVGTIMIRNQLRSTPEPADTSEA